MTSKKSGLGKGLDALFGSNEVYKDILKEQKQQEELVNNSVKEESNKYSPKEKRYKSFLLQLWKN